MRAEPPLRGSGTADRGAVVVIVVAAATTTAAGVLLLLLLAGSEGSAVGDVLGVEALPAESKPAGASPPVPERNPALTAAAASGAFPPPVPRLHMTAAASRLNADLGTASKPSGLRGDPWGAAAFLS